MRILKMFSTRYLTLIAYNPPKLIINNIYQYLPSFCFLQTILKSQSDIFPIVFSTVLILSQLTTSVLNHPHNFQHRHRLFGSIKLKYDSTIAPCGTSGKTLR